MTNTGNIHGIRAALLGKLRRTRRRFSLVPKPHIELHVLGLPRL